MKIPFAKIENFVIPAKDEQASAVMKSAWLDVEGGRLLATNGHMAVKVSVGVEEADISGLVPVEAFELARKELKVICRAIGKDDLPDPWLSVVCNEETVVIQNLLTNTTHFVSRHRMNSGEKFPAIDIVFEEVSGAPSVSLSAQYVADIVKSLDGDGLSLWVRGAEKSVVMASAMGQAAIVLMPRKEVLDGSEVNKRGMAKEKPTITEVLKEALPEIAKELGGTLEGNTITVNLDEKPEEVTEDALYGDAVKLVKGSGKASTSILQRGLRIGYGRAAHLIDRMESDGLVLPADGPKPRELTDKARA